MTAKFDHKAFSKAAGVFLVAEQRAVRVGEQVQAGRALDEDYQVALGQAQRAAEALCRVTRKG